MTLERLKEKALKKDFKWLKDLSIRAQIDELLREGQVDKETLYFLWENKEIRHSIIRKQKMPEDLVEQAIKEYLANGRSLSKTSFLTLLKKQKTNNNLIVDVYENYHQNRSDSVIDLWKNIPKKLYDADLFDSFLENKKDYIYIDKNKLSFAVIEIVKNIPSTFPQIIEEFVLETNTSNIIFSIVLLGNMAKAIYFPDEILDMIEEDIDKKSFYTFIETLVSRNNCSETKQSKYALLMM